MLQWVGTSENGNVSFASYDHEAEEITVQHSASFGGDWELTGIAGRFALAREGEQDAALFDFDGQGGLGSEVILPWPWSNNPKGSLRTLTLDQEGDCPVDLDHATYTLVWDQEDFPYGVMPLRLLQLDATGNLIDTGTLPRPTLPSTAQLTDFEQYTGSVYIALYTRELTEGGFIVWYERQPSGDFELARLDSYNGIEGLYDCKAEPGYTCDGDFADVAPGPNYIPRSLVRTYGSKATLPGTFVLWTTADGFASLMPLDARTGKLGAPAASFGLDATAQATAVEGRAPEVCPIAAEAPEAPEGEPGSLPEDPCPICD